jgi:hypothetical protein
VIHPSSVAVSREHRRAKTDRLDTELLKRAFLGWLRGDRAQHWRAARAGRADDRSVWHRRAGTGDDVGGPGPRGELRAGHIAEWLGVEPERVRLVTGDTDRVQAGGGSASARSTSRRRCRGSGRAGAPPPGAPQTPSNPPVQPPAAARPDSRRCHRRGRADCGTASLSAGRGASHVSAGVSRLLSGNECPRDQAGRARQSRGAATLPARIAPRTGSVRFRALSLGGQIEAGDPCLPGKVCEARLGWAVTDPG